MDTLLVKNQSVKIVSKNVGIKLLEVVKGSARKRPITLSDGQKNSYNIEMWL